MSKKSGTGEAVAATIVVMIVLLIIYLWYSIWGECREVHSFLYCLFK